LTRTRISPRSRKSRLGSATSSATTSPICAADAGHPGSTEAALEPNTEATVNNVNSLIQRVAGTSLSESKSDFGTRELRDLLHAEGQRVQREISGYAQLSQAAMKSTRMIADNVSQWKRPRTAFATADPETCNRRSPPPPVSGSAVVLFGMNAFELAEAWPRSIRTGRRAAARGKSG